MHKHKANILLGTLQFRTLLFATLLGLLLDFSIYNVQTAHADELYAVTGPRGSVTFTTRKPTDGRQFRLVTAPKPSRTRFVLGHRGSRYTPRAIRSAYDPLIVQASYRQRLEPALVKAVIHAESAFKPHARSPKGAMGLMQLMPATAARFGVYNAYRPEENVRGGTTYLRFLLDRYRGDIPLAVAAYNAGEGAVDRYGTIPPYHETQEYVRRVKQLLSLYRCDLAGSVQC